MRLGNLGLVVLLLIPGLVTAQAPDGSATSPAAPLLWEFDTGG
jgi:hypothetical protein